MKKLFVAFALLLSIGAGCLPVANKVVEGKWKLAFDLPEGYLMVEPYDLGSAKSLNREVSRGMSSVILQNSEKKICFAANGQCEGMDNPQTAALIEAATGDHVQITATSLDPRRVLPEEREDLGNGFSRVKLCDEGGDCQQNGAGNYEYFLETENGNYKFSYAGDMEGAEKIIRSAKPVTRFTDGLQVDAQTE